MTYCKQQMPSEMLVVQDTPEPLKQNSEYDRIRKLKKLAQTVFIENFRKRHKFREG